MRWGKSKSWGWLGGSCSHLGDNGEDGQRWVDSRYILEEERAGLVRWSDLDSKFMKVRKESRMISRYLMWSADEEWCIYWDGENWRNGELGKMESCLMDIKFWVCQMCKFSRCCFTTLCLQLIILCPTLRNLVRG